LRTNNALTTNIEEKVCVCVLKLVALMRSTTSIKSTAGAGDKSRRWIVKELMKNTTGTNGSMHKQWQRAWVVVDSAVVYV